MNSSRLFIPKKIYIFLPICLVLLSACNAPMIPALQNQTPAANSISPISTNTSSAIQTLFTLNPSNTLAPLPTRDEVPSPTTPSLPANSLSTMEPSRGHPCSSKDPGELVPTQPKPTAIATPLPDISPTPTFVLDSSLLSKRAGFGMANTTNPEYWARVLGSGWFISWQVLERSAQQIPEHWQTIRVGKGCIYPSLNFLGWAAAAFPGSVWIVGNEPDVIWQDNVLPEEYAHIYHDAYITLKGADPTAKVAVGAIAQATPLRLAYLDRVLAEYKTSFGSSLPADWWTVHGYVLREEHNSWGVEIPPGFDVKQGVLYEVADHGQLALFEQQLIIFRKWMAGRGYQNTPLALTEFGILMPPSYGFPTEMVTSYLENSFSWLQNTKDPDFGYPADNNRLVQRWAWFSLSYTTYPAPNLADLGKDQLTAIGQSFKNYVMKYKP